ncbi:hypothetical protein [Streptomyces blattellae]|uniref:hypothetical protein n=1 Tax=Streptomyces blattellae TaxID=2569855 RepID=UPI0018ACC081|nr:hypothetical protein [Streptomyces blattellae]
MPTLRTSAIRRTTRRTPATRPRANLRVDYVLPSRGLIPGSNGVFWPTSDDPLYRLVGGEPNVPTSDHRLVWQDVRVV